VTVGDGVTSRLPEAKRREIIESQQGAGALQAFRQEQALPGLVPEPDLQEAMASGHLSLAEVRAEQARRRVEGRRGDLKSAAEREWLRLVKLEQPELSDQEAEFIARDRALSGPPGAAERARPGEFEEFERRAGVTEGFTRERERRARTEREGVRKEEAGVEKAKGLAKIRAERRKRRGEEREATEKEAALKEAWLQAGYPENQAAAFARAGKEAPLPRTSQADELRAFEEKERLRAGLTREAKTAEEERPRSYAELSREGVASLRNALSGVGALEWLSGVAANAAVAESYLENRLASDPSFRRTVAQLARRAHLTGEGMADAILDLAFRKED
jgi:hypothetical protein